MYQRAGISSGGGGNVAFGVEPKPSVSGLTEIKITTGFRPKKIMWTSLPTNPSNPCDYYWDYDKDPDKFYGRQANVSLVTNGAAVGGNTYWYGLKSIDNDGFTIEKVDTYQGEYYVTGMWWAATAE